MAGIEMEESLLGTIGRTIEKFYPAISKDKVAVYHIAEKVAEMIAEMIKMAVEKELEAVDNEESLYEQ